MTKTWVHKFLVTVETTSPEDTAKKITDILSNGLYQGETDEVLVGITGYSVSHLSTLELSTRGY